MTETQDWPGTTSTVGERLKWIRVHRRYSSPRSAASTLGLQVETYRKHESGERGAHGLKDHHIRRYARAFQVSQIWLQTGRGSPFAVTMQELTPEEQRVVEALRAARGAA